MANNDTLIISSMQNPRIKKLVSLQKKSSERRKEGLFVVEGWRELTHCINGGYAIDTVFCCSELCDTDKQYGRLINRLNRVEVSADIYRRLAYRETTEGIIAVVKAKQHHLTDLKPKAIPLYVVLETVEKPGNLGAVLRSADAAGVDGVIVCDPLTDIYNPNVIRSSVGAVFTVPCIACSSEECIAYLKANHITILTAQLQDSHLYYDVDMRGATAIIMGTEATGLTDRWRKAADAHIRIPMLGHLDSLNVSVSAAILMYEAVRQRQERNGK